MRPDHTQGLLLDWMEDTFRNARGVLVPLSGGSDSALCWWLLNQVYPGKVLGVHVGTAPDSQSNPTDRKNGLLELLLSAWRRLIQFNRNSSSVLPLPGNTLRCASWFESIGKVRYIAPPDIPGIDRESARWMQFHTICLKEHYWLIGSRNRTEEVFGTYSLASRIATYFPLTGVWKSQVLQLCTLCDVPEEILASSRQADPECGRPPEMAAIPIEQIDAYLQQKINERGSNQPSALTDEQFAYLERIYKQNQWKQALPHCGPKN